MKIPFRDNREDWKIVIEVLYENSLFYSVDSLNDISDSTLRGYTQVFENVVIKNELESKTEDFEDVILKLKQTGLIKEDDTLTEPFYVLSQEGLQLAHQLKTERQRRKTNNILVVLTALIFLLTLGLLGVELTPIFIWT